MKMKNILSKSNYINYVLYSIFLLNASKSKNKKMATQLFWYFNYLLHLYLYLLFPYKSQFKNNTKKEKAFKSNKPNKNSNILYL